MKEKNTRVRIRRKIDSHVQKRRQADESKACKQRRGEGAGNALVRRELACSWYSPELVGCCTGWPASAAAAGMTFATPEFQWCRRSERAEKLAACGGLRAVRCTDHVLHGSPAGCLLEARSC